MLLALKKAKAMGIKNLTAETYSSIVAGYVKKEATAKDQQLIKYLDDVRALEKKFNGFTVQYIPRAENVKADRLAKAATKNEEIPAEVLYQVMLVPGVENTKEAHSVHHISNKDLRAPIILFLKKDLGPQSEEEEKAMQQRA